MNRNIYILLLFIFVAVFSVSVVLNKKKTDEAKSAVLKIESENKKHLNSKSLDVQSRKNQFQKRLSVKGAGHLREDEHSFLWKEHFKDSQIIEEQVSDLPNGNLKRKVLLRTSMKYKNVILEEEISQSEDGFKVIVDQKAMVADHIIVALDKATPVEELFELNTLFKGALSKKIGKSQVYLIKFDEFDIDTVNEKIPLYQSGNIKVAEPDYLVYTTNTPNDPSYSNLYGLHNTGQTGGADDADIDAPEAWDISVGSQNVLVGVIDTGVDYNHPDLAANMWINPNEIPGNGIDDDNNGYIDDVRGWDFVNNDNDPMDDHYHGTHCAGTIGAVGNNEEGITGVCWNVSMVGLKFLSGSGSGTTSDAIEAVLYGTTIGVDMTSNSWGGGGFSQALKDAIDDAGADDILFIAAAGNSSVNNDSSPHYPSSYESDNVISVAATDHNDQRASFTNYGLTSVDLGAPGVNIYSCSPNGGYQNLSGTSMATPHVAGAAALLKSLNPALTYSQTKTQLMQSADPIPALDGYCVSGARLNVFKSLLFASGPYLVTTENIFSDGELGNGDGIFNPGESITFDFSVLNVGGEFAFGVNAALTSSTEGISVSPANIFIGNMSTGFAIDPVQNFVIEVEEAVTTPLAVDLSLIYTDNEGETWTTPLAIDVYSSINAGGHISALTGNLPVEGAVISYTGPTSGQTVSDVNGNYTFSGIDGTYTISVSAAGYNNTAPVEVTLPPARNDINFQLSRAAIQITPNSISTNLNPGDSTTETITISNDGDAPLNFSVSALTQIESNSVASDGIKYSSNHHRPFAKGTLDTRKGIPVLNGVGGPDTFGYQWMDSNEPGGPQFIWNDISNTGTLLSNISNSDDSYELVDLPFSFPYYGTDYSTVYVSSNGYVTVGSGSSQYANYPLPSTSAPTGQIAGFADDLNPSNGGSVYYQIDNGKLIVQFDNVAYYSGSGTCSFQIVLDQNGAVTYYYNSMTGSLTSATVGIQNISRDDGLTVAYNTAYIENGLAVRMSAGPIWVNLPVQSGVVNPGSSVEVDVQIDSTGLNAGIHNAILQISHNAPGTTSVNVPLELEINSVRILSVSPESHDYGSLFLGASSVQNFNFENTGNAEITISSLNFSGNSFTSPVNLPLNIPAFSSISVPVHFAPASLGSLTSDLSIGHNADNQIGTITLTGIGLEAPVASLNPDNLNFNLAAGNSESQITVLSNGGGSDLEFDITNITFNSSNTAGFNYRKGSGRPAGDMFVHRHVPNQLIVSMKNGVDNFQALNILNSQGLNLVRQLGMVKKPGFGVRAFNKTVLLTEAAAGTDLSVLRNELLKDPNIEYVEPNYIVSLVRTPDDSSYSQLYGMHNTGQTGGTPDADIDAPEAWDLHTGNPDNVLIGVIDTGINYNHPDLVDNIWINPGEIAGNGIDDDGNGYIDDIHGWDFVNNDHDPMDDHSHGTHCAGTIAGSGNNGQGVVGVMWNARLVGLKFLSASGSGNTADAVDTLLYANAMDIHITSNSWGGGGYSQVMKDAIDAAAAENRLFIAAAGNSSSNNDSSPHYPSSYESDNVIAVAATDHNDALASFSSYGATSVDIAAPGVNIYSTVLGSGYDSFSGTSMATPHVAGVAGLLWSYAPTAGGSTVKDAIYDSADSLANLQGVVLTGGRLNAFEALQSITPPWFEISPTTGSVVSGSSQDLTITVDAAGQVAGTYSATVDINTNDPLNPVLQLSVNAVITGEKRLVPDLAQLNFPLTKVGENSVIQLTLTNSGADHTEISDISLPQGFSHTETLPLTVNAYQSITVPVTFTPTSAASYSGTLQIFNDSVDGDLSLPISGEGRIGAAIEVDPLEITLSMNNGEQRTETVNISNIGDMTLDYSIVVNALTTSANSHVYGPEHHAPLKKGAVDTRTGQPVIKGSGGPDSFGYSWSDSNEPGGPQYVWNDISTTGTRLAAISSSDDSYEAVNISFNFPYYGTDYSTVYVSSNGYLTVGSGSSQFSNYPLPSTSSPAGQIAGFADDLHPGSGGDIYYKEEANKLIIQFENVRKIGSSLGYTFQIVIDQHGAITYYYNSMDATLTSSTIGIQNTLRNDGLTVAYNTAYVTNGMAVRISTAPAWLTVNPESGTVNAGESQNISLDFDTTSLGRGTHQSSLSIANNSVSSPTVNIPITLTISNTAPSVSDINVNTVQDSPAEIVLAGSDIDNDPLAYEILTDPVNGLVSLNGGTVTYTPNPGFNGSDSFTYKANDGFTDSGTATVFVTVDPLEPKIISSTSSVYFSSAYIGQSRTYNVTFTNSGNSPTTVSEINISNPVFSHAETLPIVLNAGTSRTVVLTFTPDTAIEHLGTCTVVSDAIDNPNLSISLRGYGNLPYLNQIRFDTVIADGQYIGTPFSVTVSALNNLGNLMTDFNGTGSLSADGTTVVPATGLQFVNGGWTGQITVTAPVDSTRLVLSAGSRTGYSNTFDVKNAPVSSPDSYTTKVGVPLVISSSPGSNVVNLVRSISFTGSISEMDFSEQFGYLCIRESANSVKIINPFTNTEISAITPENGFHDMDLTPDGRYLYVTDHQPNYGYESEVDLVHKYDLLDNTWTTYNTLRETRLIEAVSGSRFLSVQGDQHTSMSLNEIVGESLIELDIISSDYYGNPEYDHSTGKVFIGNSGSSSREIHLRQVDGDTLLNLGDTGGYGSAQNGGGSSVLASDASVFYYGDLQVDANDITDNLNEFPEVILAAGSTVAFGSNSYYFAKDANELGQLGFSGSGHYVTPSGKTLWVFDASTNQIHQYSVSSANLGSVLANDTDIDGDTLTASLDQTVAPVTGTLAFNSDGTFTYTPAAGFTGSATFTYIASDSELTSSIETVTINVEAESKELVAGVTDLDFGNVILGNTVQRVISLTNTGNTIVSISDVAVDNVRFSILGDIPLTVGPGATDYIIVSFSATDVTEQSGVLTIASDATISELSVGLFAHGRVGAQIEVTPLEISATLYPGQSETRNVSIFNSGDLPFEFSLGLGFETVTPFSAYGAEHFTPLHKGEEDLRKGNPVLTGIGGPDSFGYSWIDSDEVQGPEFVWNDISITGTLLETVSGSDDNYQQVALSTPFNYYGIDYNSIFVSSNGFITFSSGTSSLSNYPLPSTSAPATIVAGFHDDLNPGSGGEIYFQEDGGDKIIQFENVMRYGGSGTYTFQIILKSNGKILLNYKTMTGNVSSGTAGIQNHLRDDGLTVAYNTSTYFHDELSVLISQTPEWVLPQITEGIVEPGQTVIIPVDLLVAEDMEPGVYENTMSISHNALNTEDQTVNISLTVPENTVPPEPPVNIADGIKYSYFENNGSAWSVLPDFSTLTPKTVGMTDVVDDKVAERTDHFGIVFEGFLDIPESGTWTFSTRSDDGSKLYINDVVIVDNDGLHGAVERFGVTGLEAGKHKVRVEFFERTGGDIVELYWEGPNQVKEQVPETAFSFDDTYKLPEYPENRFNGLAYSYFENNGAHWSVLPDFSTLTPKTVGTTDVVDDKVAERGEDFGLVFEGFIEIPQDGEWTFYTRSDDGSKFYIADEEIVNNDGLHGSRERSGVKALHAGLHRISVEFFERGGGDFVELYWEGPGQVKQLVPASAFFVEEILDPVKDDFYALGMDTDLIVPADEGVQANDALIDIDVELLSSTANGVITLETDGSFTYTPNSGFEGIDQFTYSVVGGSADQTGTVTLAVKNGAGVQRDVYLGISGMNLTQLRQDPIFANPDITDVMTNFEGPTNWNDSYATRLRSRVIAPVSGTYNFYVAGDDSTELLYSEDSSGAGASKIAGFNGWTSSRQWNKYSTQRSIAIPLTAGQVIYLEALSIEGGGGDNLAAGWSIDGGAINVITNEFILFPEGSVGSGTEESSIPEGQTVSTIGNVAFGTLVAYDSGTYLISASGADIWGSNDAFGFIHQDISGDIELVAKVNSLTNTNSWAKAGVMIRETLNPDSKHAMSIITPGNGVSLQHRTVTGGASASTSFGGISAPQWVKILRVGDSFTGYFSSEGSVWFPINTISISMTADVKAGLALTSHDNSQETESIITDFSVKSPNESSAVTRFVLVNADTGEDIRELSHNSTINLTEDGLNLSVRAETSGTNESVVFQVNGSAHFTANESVYTISGTTEGSYNAWTPAIGSMTLMATPYSQDDGSGNVGSSLAIVVTVSE